MILLILISLSLCCAVSWSDYPIVSVDLGSTSAVAAVQNETHCVVSSVLPVDSDLVALFGRIKDDANSVLAWPVSHAIVLVTARESSERVTEALDAVGLTRIDRYNRMAEIAAFGALNELDIETNEQILSLHFGGRTFGLVLVEEMFIAMNVLHEDRFGGVDLDELVAAHLRPRFPVDEERLRAAVEEAKRRLSTELEATVRVDEFAETLTRVQFEALIDDALKQRILPALLSAKEQHAVDYVVLEGGSAAIPRVRELVASVFGAEKVIAAAEPEQIVARGLAARFSTMRSRGNDGWDPCIVSVAHLSVGVETVGETGEKQMYVVVPRNKPLPTEASVDFTTAEDGQTRVSVPILVGERALSKDNRLVGELQLELTGAPLPQLRVSIAIDMDDAETLVASVVDLGTGRSDVLSIPRHAYMVTRAELERIRQEGEDWAAHDEPIRARVSNRLAPWSGYCDT